MQINRTSLYLTRIFLDITILILSFILSAYLTVKNFNFLRFVNVQFLLLSLLVIWYFSSKSNKLYDEFRSRNFSHELIALIRNIFIQIISAIIILFLLKEERLSRYFVILFSISSLILISTEKLLVRRVLNYMRLKGRNIRRLIIIGAGEIGKNFYKSIKNNPHFGYKTIGFVDDKVKTFLNGQYLGKIDELDVILSKQRVDNVVIALPNYASEKINDIVYICNRNGIRAKIVPDFHSLLSGKFAVNIFGDLPIITIGTEPLEEILNRFIKRLFDIMFSSFVIIFIMSWITPIIWFLNKFYSPGTTFFVQDRVGRKDELFSCYKFRSMHVDCSKNRAEFTAVSKNDNRISKIGKILRKTNLDELPQFINVLKGEMSVVGPRPHAIAWNDLYSKYVKDIKLRHRIKPGITGWAQIHGYRGDVEDIEKNKLNVRKRIELDLWYLENWTFGLDLEIIVLTVWKMIKSDLNGY